MLRRLVPHPLLAAILAAIWLILQESLAPGDVAVGVLLGLLLSRVMVTLEQAPPSFKRPAVGVALFFVVLYDIVKSNIAVGYMMLARRRRSIRSGFVNVPLEMKSPYALAALATIITATPGTFWAAYDTRTNVVTIHVLDLIDPEEWVGIVKGRYERRLLAVFE